MLSLRQHQQRTVTGLGVVDTASTFTMFGEIVIMLLIQTGGLGLMTIAILIVWVLGKNWFAPPVINWGSI